MMELSREQTTVVKETGTIEKPFANGLNFYKLFWIFAIGSYVGVLLETAWGLLMTGRLESRAGMLYGPFNAVYGFGAVLMTGVLYRLREHGWYWLLLGGCLLGASFEFISSVIQEKMFGTVSWNYEDMPFNLGGRTNLVFALGWGILALLWMKGIYPRLSEQIEKIPDKVGVALTWVMIVFFAVNMTLSTLAAVRMTARHEGVAAQNVVDVFLDTYYHDDRMMLSYTHTIYVNEDGTKTNMSLEEQLRLEELERQKAASEEQ